MNHFEIVKCLESMRVLVDSREQETERARERYRQFPCKYDRCKLEYGDYAYNFQFPNETWLYNQSMDADKIYPSAAIERKMNIDEVCSCFGKERKRFEAEFQRAKDHGARLYLLVENATWENILNGQYKSRLNANALTASLLAWQARYDMRIVFCKAETTGKMIYNILYRELKEYLEGLEAI